MIPAGLETKIYKYGYDVNDISDFEDDENFEFDFSSSNKTSKEKNDHEYIAQKSSSLNDIKIENKKPNNKQDDDWEDENISRDRVVSNDANINITLNYNSNEKLNNNRLINSSSSSSSKNSFNNNAGLGGTKSNEVLYELNNNYYYDEFNGVVEDLKIALMQKNLDLVKNLFSKHNISVNCKFKTNWIPIMYAGN